jgi:hypothetical protein
MSRWRGCRLRRRCDACAWEAASLPGGAAAAHTQPAAATSSLVAPLRFAAPLPFSRHSLAPPPPPTHTHTRTPPTPPTHPHTLPVPPPGDCAAGGEQCAPGRAVLLLLQVCRHHPQEVQQYHRNHLHRQAEMVGFGCERVASCVCVCGVRLCSCVWVAVPVCVLVGGGRC